MPVNPNSLQGALIPYKVSAADVAAGNFSIVHTWEVPFPDLTYVVSATLEAPSGSLADLSSVLSMEIQARTTRTVTLFGEGSALITGQFFVINVLAVDVR